MFFSKKNFIFQKNTFFMFFLKKHVVFFVFFFGGGRLCSSVCSWSCIAAICKFYMKRLCVKQYKRQQSKSPRCSTFQTLPQTTEDSVQLTATTFSQRSKLGQALLMKTIDLSEENMARRVPALVWMLRLNVKTNDCNTYTAMLALRCEIYMCFSVSFSFQHFFLMFLFF